MSKHTTPELMISKNLKLYYLLRHKPSKERRENERGKCKMVLLCLAHDVLSLNEREKSVLVRFFYVTSFLVAGFFFFFLIPEWTTFLLHMQECFCVYGEDQRDRAGCFSFSFPWHTRSRVEAFHGICFRALKTTCAEFRQWGGALCFKSLKKKKKSNQMF